MSKKAKKIEIENINVPGKSTKVDAVEYAAMKKVFLEILPSSTPGLSQKEIQQLVKAHLPESIFPQGATSAWWAKTVQLDLEAKGIVTRENCKPLQWYKTGLK